MKRATVLDEGPGQFALQYDNTLGKKNQMRLDAETYENAILEARSFLGINEDDHDEAGDQWAVE
jgi:hypothetical protein